VALVRSQVAGIKRWPELQRRGRETRGGGEREKRKITGPNSKNSNLYFLPMNSNVTISLITFACELRFLRTTYARARFNVLYNFREETFLKF